MKRPPTSRPPSRLGKLRPWVLPIVFGIMLLTLYEGSFDAEAVRADLAAGRPEEALTRLSRTPREQLPPELASVRWWPAAARELQFRTLAIQVAEDPDENLTLPSFVAPLDTYRVAPRTIRVREPATQALTVDIENLELGLPVGSFPLGAGQTELTPDVLFIPGTRFVMKLKHADTGLHVALAAFEVLPPQRAAQASRAMDAGRALARGENGGENGGEDVSAEREAHGAALMAALVALHHELHAEALELLEPLTAVDGYRETARELKALALAAQGLDQTALELSRSRSRSQQAQAQSQDPSQPHDG